LNHLNDWGKSFGTVEEFEFRKAIFKEKYNFMLEWNNDPNQTHKLTTDNEFATWTDEEYKRLLGFSQEMADQRLVKGARILDESNLKDSVNWVTEGKVSKVKNQGQCGSCWSFSTTGAMESANAIAGNEMTLISEQQFVDCDHVDQGCNGGLPSYAFEYAEEHPIMTESDYPYKAKKNPSYEQQCDEAKDQGVISVDDYDEVPKSASQFKAALQKQPLSIAVEADQRVFQMYTKGVITSDLCGTKLDHAVLAVGYGTLDGEDYFLVKNSWSASWGDEGYLRIGTDNVCGILQQGTYPSTSTINQQ